MSQAVGEFDVRRIAPERDETAAYYHKYIDRVGAGDIRDVLEAQRKELAGFFGRISEEQSRFRYAPGKWSIRQVLNHINDTERVFAFRAFWFARGCEGSLPSFEQDLAMQHSAADDRSWKSHMDEFTNVRSATLHVFRELPLEAWMRRGIASDVPFTVRSLAFITAGHASHHADIIRERYLKA